MRPAPPDPGPAAAEWLRARSPIAAAALALSLFAACSSPERTPPVQGADAGQSRLQGWQHCSGDNCGRGFVSAYSTLVFLRLDGESVRGAATLAVPPGRHWIEAHYAWGVGVLVGVGNYRNYGFEFDFVAGHQYAIRDVPSGCLVPASKSWVSPKVLRVEDQAPDRRRMVHEVKAMEYCAPGSSEPGTCRTNSDCRSGPCTPFDGSTGFGLCGQLR